MTDCARKSKVPKNEYRVAHSKSESLGLDSVLNSLRLLQQCIARLAGKRGATNDVYMYMYMCVYMVCELIRTDRWLRQLRSD